MNLRNFAIIAAMSALPSFAFAQTSAGGAINAGATVGTPGAAAGAAADINAGTRSMTGPRGASADTAAGAQVDAGRGKGVGATAGTGAGATVSPGPRTTRGSR
jgi:hypothetical protein